jgi:hypothetical protein
MLTVKIEEVVSYGCCQQHATKQVQYIRGNKQGRDVVSPFTQWEGSCVSHFLQRPPRGTANSTMEVMIEMTHTCTWNAVVASLVVLSAIATASTLIMYTMFPVLQAPASASSHRCNFGCGTACTLSCDVKHSSKCVTCICH